MHPNSVYATIKALLADLTNRPKSQITKDKRLSGKWPGGLNFTAPGLAGLVQKPNVRFDDIGHRIKPSLHPGEVNGSMTVESLFALIRPRV